MTELSEWDSFYLIVGGAAGALIGLQFVVMTLISSRTKDSPPEAGAAFATPTIIHFCAALLLAALMRVPWKWISSFAVVLGVVGAAGIVYAAIVVWRLRTQNAYKPVFEDWLCHAILPLLAYTSLLAAAGVAISYEREALFMIGGSSLLLLFIGIHNAWDGTTYHVFEVPAKNDEADGDQADSSPDNSKSER